MFFFKRQLIQVYDDNLAWKADGIRSRPATLWALLETPGRSWCDQRSVGRVTIVAMASLLASRVDVFAEAAGRPDGTSWADGTAVENSEELMVWFGMLWGVRFIGGKKIRSIHFMFRRQMKTRKAPAKQPFLKAGHPNMFAAPRCRIDWLKTLAPGDALVEETSTMWILRSQDENGAHGNSPEETPAPPMKCFQRSDGIRPFLNI